MLGLVSSKISVRSIDGTFLLTIFSQRAYISYLDRMLGGFLNRCEEAGEKLLRFSSAVMAVFLDVMLLSDDLLLGVCLILGGKEGLTP